ncbi:MAG: hypothetical protein AB1641_28455 [Thermodesulfobacteriota bacterium]
MSSREKVIIALMAVAILFGGYNFLFTKGSDQKQAGPALVKKSVDEARQLVSEVTVSLTKESISPLDARYVIARASAAWPGDPFLERQTAIIFETEKIKAEAPEITNKELGLRYTGYLSAGAKNLAVLNGTEYEEGDKLEREGNFIVKSITPTQVIIGREGSAARIVVPLEETEF